MCNRTGQRSPCTEALAALLELSAAAPPALLAFGKQHASCASLVMVLSQGCCAAPGLRYSRRPAPPAGATPGSSVHHLKCVPRPLPTHKHPLVGLWAAECGGADIEVLRILYDFSGTSARIVAIKVRLPFQLVGRRVGLTWGAAGQSEAG